MSKPFLLLFFLIFISCTFSSSEISHKLRRLDKEIRKHPESILDSLSQINPEKLHKTEKAYYYLVEAHAKDKNYRKLSSDSTLRLAENYFSAAKDYYNLGRTQYYIAKFLYTANHPEEAYITLKQAESHLQESKKGDPHVLGLIHYLLGLIQDRQNNPEEAENHYTEAIGYFRDDKDTASIVFTSRQLAWCFVSRNKDEKAKEILLQTISLIKKASHTPAPLYAKLYSSVLNALSHVYQKTGVPISALQASRESIQILTDFHIPATSNLYSTLITAFQKINASDSAAYYCHKMSEAAEQENNLINQIKSYQILVRLEEAKGNYKTSSHLKDKYILLKDDFNKKLKFEKLIELEKRYNYSEKERLYLKAKNKNLWLSLIGLIFTIVATLVLLYYNWQHRKLKEKNMQLAEEIRKTQWGFILSKELIADNSSSYEELERLVIRNINHIPEKLFNEFQTSLRARKNNYSKHLFSALTNIDSNFIERLQQKYPDLSTDEVMLVSMLRYQWDLHDIAKVFRVSFEAIKKRKQRLRQKLLGNENQQKDLEEYLNNI